MWHRNRLAAAFRVLTCNRLRVSAARREFIHLKPAAILVLLLIAFCAVLDALPKRFLRLCAASSLHSCGRRLTIAPDFRPRVPRCGHGCRSLGRTEIREGGPREKP